jgi:hypothetical protein
MSFIWIPNKALQAELAHDRRESSEDIAPGQRLPVDTTAYYYVEKRILDTTRPSRLGIDIPGSEITVFTYYCLVEAELREHREGRINYISEETVPYTDEDVAFAHPANSKMEYEVSEIKSKPTPLRYRNRISRTVQTTEGPF